MSRQWPAEACERCYRMNKPASLATDYYEILTDNFIWTKGSIIPVCPLCKVMLEAEDKD